MHGRGGNYYCKTEYYTLTANIPISWILCSKFNIIYYNLATNLEMITGLIFTSTKAKV